MAEVTLQRWSDDDHLFKTLWGSSSEAVGRIGYWKKNWQDPMTVNNWRLDLLSV